MVQRVPLSDADLVGAMRSSIVVVDAFGTLLQIVHPDELVFGHRLEDMLGRNALEFTTPESAEILVATLMDGGDHVVRHEPPPFQVDLFDADGSVVSLECLPRRIHRDGERLWVLQFTEHTMTSQAFYGLDVLLDAGGSRDLATRVAERWTSTWDEGVRTAMCASVRDEDGAMELIAPRSAHDQELFCAVESHLQHAAVPWNRLDPALGPQTIPTAELPPAIRAAADAAGYEICQCSIAAVGDDRVALIGFGSHPLALGGGITALLDQAVRTLTTAMQRDIAERMLRHAAEHDPLTSLANRTRFDRALDRALEAECQLGVIYVDIDHFKSINDSFGHAVGDLDDHGVADGISATCRTADVVARIGGDEFAIVLDQADPNETERIAGRLVDTIRQPLPTSMGPFRVTVSVGVAFGASTDVVDAADDALYASKRAGRDRWVTAQAVR